MAHVSPAQELQFGHDNDGDQYVFLPFKGDHLSGELFKNERDMYAIFLHFKTKEVHTPEKPHCQVFLKKGDEEIILKPMTIEYIHNSLTDISTLSAAFSFEDFSRIAQCDEIEYVTMETTDGERKSFINVTSHERKVIPNSARELLKVRFPEH